MKKLLTMIILSMMLVITGCTGDKTDKNTTVCNGQAVNDVTEIENISQLEDGEKVTVCGVVTAWDYNDNFFVQDDTASIYVFGQNNLGSAISHDVVGKTILLQATIGTYKGNSQLKVSLNDEYEFIDNQNNRPEPIVMDGSQVSNYFNQLVKIENVNIIIDGEDTLIKDKDGNFIANIYHTIVSERDSVSIVGVYYFTSDDDIFVISDPSDISYFELGDEYYQLPTSFEYDGPVFPTGQVSTDDFWSGNSGLIPATLGRCVDGDTARFIFNNEQGKSVNESFRYLVVDTAETSHPDIGAEPWGKPASEYMCDLLSGAEEIYLQSDPVSGARDDYGRMLGWIWVDGELAQYNLVALGLADTKYSYYDGEAELYADLLIERNELAVTEKVGRWSGLLDPYWDYINNEPLGW